MAHIEVNAMSVKLFSTFEAEVFFPGLHLEAGERYPVVWFIHPDGTGPVELERYTDLLEGYAEKKKIFIIAPDISHSLCTDMVWGTWNEQFIAEECPGIFRFLYPLSGKPEDQYLLGIGSGAYGAAKVASHYRDRFRTAILVNGELDIAAKCRMPRNRERFSHQTADSLDALFGCREKVEGSREDLYAESCKTPVKTILACSRQSLWFQDNQRYAERNTEAEVLFTDDDISHFGVCRLLEQALDSVF